MLITIKKIPGSECNLEVPNDSTVIFVKELVAKNMKIPVNQQKLVYKGKTLTEDMSLKDYQVIEGSKVHLFVVDGSASSQSTARPANTDINRFYIQLSEALEKYYSKSDTIKIIEEFKRNLMADIDDMSLDDIERLAKIKLSQHRTQVL